MWKEIWQVILTAAASVAALFLLTKLMGNKQISHLSMFDYIVGITIGSIAAELATELENPVLPLVAMVVYALLATLVSIVTNRSIKLRRLLSGRPTVLLDAGAIYRDRLAAARLDLGDFLTLARTAGYFNLSDIETAVLEENGDVSFLPKSVARPLTAKEQNAFPPQDRMPTTLIEDGRVIVENLVYLGRDGEWLRKELSSLGYAAPESVFFAAADAAGKVFAFGMAPDQESAPV